LWVGAVVGLGLAAGLAFWAVRKRLGIDESPLVRHLIPRTAEERLLFVLVVAPTAGIVEEMLFRGFAVSRLAELVPGGAWTAAILSLVGFALGHVYQGPLGLCRAGLLGAFLSLPFLATGSLLPSILAHTLLDILGGVFLGRYLLEGGEPATTGRREG
jgi:membrane protease YdiL (CAAX protease family)